MRRFTDELYYAIDNVLNVFRKEQLEDRASGFEPQESFTINDPKTALRLVIESLNTDELRFGYALDDALKKREDEGEL